MPRVFGIGPGGRAAPLVRDDRYRPVIELVRTRGELDLERFSPPCSSRALAEDVRKGLYRSARYYCSCDKANCTRKYPNTPHDANPDGGCPEGGQRISCRALIVKDEAGRWRVAYVLHDKTEAMRAVIRKYGRDPSKWPYQARARKLRRKS